MWARCRLHSLSQRLSSERELIRIPFAEKSRLARLESSIGLAGLTLFTPMNGEVTVYLMDLNGKIGHTWEMPYPPGLYGYLTERERFSTIARSPPIRFSDGRLLKGGVAVVADWADRILWKVREANHHHDGRLLKNGNVRNGMPRDIAGRVRAVSFTDSDGWLA